MLPEGSEDEEVVHFRGTSKLALPESPRSFTGGPLVMLSPVSFRFATEQLDRSAADLT